MSNSVWPHRRQPTRFPRPWDSPGKNSGVGCHVLLQCRKVKSESEVTQSCLTVCDPMDCSLPGFSVHGIFQARDISISRCICAECGHFPVVNSPKRSFEMKNQSQAKGFLRCVSMGNFKQVKDHYQMIYVGKLFRGPSFKNIFSPLSRPTCKLFGILTSVACAPA